jgi:hypothetical protein
VQSCRVSNLVGRMFRPSGDRAEAMRQALSDQGAVDVASCPVPDEPKLSDADDRALLGFRLPGVLSPPLERCCFLRLDGWDLQGQDARIVTEDAKDIPRKMSLRTAAGLVGVPSVPLKAFLRFEEIA